MTFRTSRKPALANLAERKEHRKFCQRAMWLTLAEWRQAKADAVAKLAHSQAAMNRNRQQSAHAQLELK